MSRRYVDRELGGTPESRRAEASRERRRLAALEWGHRTGLEEWGQAWERARRRLARELGSDPTPAVVRRELTVLQERRQGARERYQAQLRQYQRERREDGQPQAPPECARPEDLQPRAWSLAIARARRCLSVWELTDERQIRRMLWELERGCCEYRWDPEGGPGRRGGHIALTRGREPATGRTVRIGEVVDIRQGAWDPAVPPADTEGDGL